MESGISLWLSQWAARQPDKVLISFEDRRITWAAFDTDVSRLADALGTLGVTKGTRVGILLRNCPEFLQTFWALARTGAIFIPLNVHLTARELAWIVNNAGIDVVVTDAGFDAVVTAVRDEVPVRHWISVTGTLSVGSLDFGSLVAGATERTVPVAIAPSDPVGILYTSGTTGLPKGAVLTHGNILHITLNYILNIGLGRNDLFLNFLPLCFTGGSIASMWVFHAGASMILERDFDAARVIALVDERKVTYSVGVPTMFKMIADHPDFARADWSTLRSVMLGGAASPISLLEALQAKGVKGVQGFGLTESGALSLVLEESDAARKIGSTGSPCVYVDAKVVDAAGAEVAPGEIGELLLSGPCIMQGYWENPVATAETLVDGWLHTGDLVTRDADGDVYVKDRKKEMIISGGLNVYPAEVENVLYRFDEIAECAVVGLPDETWGERVTAVVTLRPGRQLGEAELIRRARAELAAYKTPKQVVFVDTLPKTVSGKVQKRVLRDRLLG